MDAAAAWLMIALVASLLIASGCCKKKRKAPRQKPAAGGYNQAPTRNIATQPLPQPVAPGVMPRCNCRCHTHYCRAATGSNLQSIPNVNPSSNQCQCGCLCHVAATPTPMPAPTAAAQIPHEPFVPFPAPAPPMEIVKPMDEGAVVDGGNEQYKTLAEVAKSDVFKDN